MKKLIFASALFFGCEKATVPDQTTASEDVSYHYHVQPFIEMYCISCHNAGTASAELYDYDHVAATAASGELVGCLTGNPNYIPMPPSNSNQPNTFQIDQIEKWVEAGYPNN